MLEYHGERFGSDGVELSSHAISAPDHLPVHSERQLKEFAENSKKKYDLTRQQRAMETKLRSLKTRRLAASAAGDELEAKRLQRKINEQQTIYRRFSEKHDLLYDTQRASVEGYRRISVKNAAKTLENSNQNDILKDSENQIIKISKTSIDNIPLVQTSTMPQELAYSLQRRHRDVLERASKLPAYTEVGMVCDMNGNMIKTIEGEHGEGNVTLPKLNFPYITIHNHPSGKMHSHTDLQKLLFNENQIISSVVGNNGNVYLFRKSNGFDGFACYEAYYNKALPKFEEAIDKKDLASYFKIMDNLIKECKKYGLEFNTGTN